MNDSANKIQNGAFLPRKRHEYRLLWSMLLGVMTLFDASAAYALPTFVVNSTRDAVDATPGDGLCATTNTNVHECTLRAAIRNSVLSISVPPALGPWSSLAVLPIPSRQRDPMKMTVEVVTWTLKCR